MKTNIKKHKIKLLNEKQSLEIRFWRISKRNVSISPKFEDLQHKKNGEFGTQKTIKILTENYL